MGWIKTFAESVACKQAINYVDKNPIDNFPKLLKLGGKLASSEKHKNTIETVANILKDKEKNWYKLIERILTEISPEARKKLLVNYFLNAGLLGIPENAKNQEKEKCNIPWAILLDPTAACNLKCIGCWAAEYNQGDSLDNETIERIID